MEREKKEIITPISQNKIILKTWLTAREKREITAIYLMDTELKADQTYSISANKYFDAQNKTLENIVISIDGNESDVLEKALDMRSEDFDFLITEINKLTITETEESKK